MITKDDFWDKCGYVTRSKNRKIVLKALDKPQTPSDLRKKTKLSMNLVSRALRELDKKGVVICKNPKSKMGRIYDLSELGKRIQKSLNS